MRRITTVPSNEQLQRTALRVALASMLLAAGCGTGNILDSGPGSEPEPPAQPPADGPGADPSPPPITPAPEPPDPVSPPPSGGPGWTPPALDARAPVSPSPRLRGAEYRSTVARAFGLNASALVDVALPADGSDDKIFTTNATDRIGDFRVYVDAAEQIAERVAADLAGACDWATATAACLRSSLRPSVERLFRSSVSDADIAEWTTVYQATRDDGAPEQIALATIVAITLLDERFLFHREVGEAPGAVSTALTDRELASRLSYLITDAPPDADLLALVDAGTLRTQLSTQIRRLISTPAAEEMIWRFVSGWLSLPAERPDAPVAPPPPPPTDECNLTAECKAIHGDRATDCVNSQSNTSWCACGVGVRCAPLPPPPEAVPSLEYSAWEETRRFVIHVFSSDTIPLSELFSANYSFIDSTLAAHYGVPAPEQAWQRYEFPDGANRVGVLSHASFLATNGSHERDVSWIFRGKAMYERLFCGVLGLPMEGAIAEEVEDRQTHPFCGGCHAIMDPLGKLFDGFDDTGKYIGTDFTTLPVFANSDIDGDYAGLAAFMANIENSEAFEHCFVRMWFRFALGRPPTETDEASYAAAVAALSTGQTAKSAMIKILETEAFGALYDDPSRMVCQ